MKHQSPAQSVTNGLIVIWKKRTRRFHATQILIGYWRMLTWHGRPKSKDRSAAANWRPAYHLLKLWWRKHVRLVRHWLMWDDATATVDYDYFELNILLDFAVKILLLYTRVWILIPNGSLCLFLKLLIGCFPNVPAQKMPHDLTNISLINIINLTFLILKCLQPLSGKL